MNITNVQVWAREVEDRPGGLADVLRAIADAGGNVECVIARREPNMPGRGQVFVTLAKGRNAQGAAGAAGLNLVEDVSTLRVEGPDSPGLGARLTGALAKAQINVRGVSTAVSGGNFVCYIGLDSAHDAQAAIPALKHVKGGLPTVAGKTRRRGATATKRAAGKSRATKRPAGKRPATKRAAAKRPPAKRPKRRQR